MSAGLTVLLAVLLVATAFGLWRRRVDGRLMAAPAATAERPERPGPAAATERDTAATLPVERLATDDLGTDLGERATLVQFSTAFCTPCRATRRILGEVERMVPGVAHVEVDAEARLDLVRRLGVTRTPTVLVLDAQGTVVRRATGAPRSAAAVVAALPGPVT